MELWSVAYEEALGFLLLEVFNAEQIHGSLKVFISILPDGGKVERTNFQGFF